ncbi:MAG: ATP-binding protein [Erysipelotrichaceae bacterium]
MKSGITRRLIAYFVGVILLFAIILSGMFVMMFRNQTVANVKNQILSDARDLATLTAEPGVTNTEVLKQFNNLDSFLSDAQLWIVTPDGKIWARSMGGGMGMGMHNNVGTLPKSVKDVVNSVLAGNEKNSENFSDVFRYRTLTVGVPVYNLNHEVIAAILISASASMVQGTANMGIRILFMSTIVGIIIAVLAGYFLSKRFIKPVLVMDKAVSSMADGNYATRIDAKGNDEIGELGQKLNVLSGRLEDASRQSANLEKMRQSFIADITHELRTPVTVLRGYAEGLSDGIYPKDYNLQDVSQQMIRETTGMQRLIGDLLELSRLEDPDFKLVLSEVEFHDILNDVLRGSTQRAQLNGINLTTDIEEGLWKFKGDYDRLRMMLNAVLDNALKFTPQGKNIHVCAKKEGNRLIISISDEGAGMTQERQDQLFKRYQRIKDPNNPQGSGLGLAIAANIATRHNIKIEVDSQENQGSTFKFIIPSAG